MIAPPIARIILYVSDIRKVAVFYETHLGFERVPSDEPGWLELASPNGGCCIALHQAAKTQKRGSAAKIVFWVDDVHKFKQEKEAQGLKFALCIRLRDFSSRMPRIQRVTPSRSQVAQ